jgi:hypothetical protein
MNRSGHLLNHGKAGKRLIIDVADYIPGPCSRLQDRILALLLEPEFGMLTNAEVIGTLELLKWRIAREVDE